MNVGFELLLNVVTGFNSNDEPVYGNVLKVMVNGQLFQKIFKVVEIPTKFRIEREELKLFGVSLQEIGKEIELQAVHGRPQKIVLENGVEQTFF